MTCNLRDIIRCASLTFKDCHELHEILNQKEYELRVECLKSILNIKFYSILDDAIYVEDSWHHLLNKQLFIIQLDRNKKNWETYLHLIINDDNTLYDIQYKTDRYFEYSYIKDFKNRSFGNFQGTDFKKYYKTRDDQKIKEIRKQILKDVTSIQSMIETENLIFKTTL